MVMRARARDDCRDMQRSGGRAVRRRMGRLIVVVNALLLLTGCHSSLSESVAAVERPAPQAGASKPTPAPAAGNELDRLLAPIALYPDQLLAQMLLCAVESRQGGGARRVAARANETLQGHRAAGRRATVAGFEPSFVALALFPQVVDAMAQQLDWTTQLGKAFAADRTAVFASIQRLRATGARMPAR